MYRAPTSMAVNRPRPGPLEWGCTGAEWGALALRGGVAGWGESEGPPEKASPARRGQVAEKTKRARCIVPLPQWAMLAGRLPASTTGMRTFGRGQVAAKTKRAQCIVPLPQYEMGNMK